MLRSNRAKEAVHTPQAFELLVNISHKPQSEEKDYLANLELAAIEQDFKIIASARPLDLARRILQMEAA
ncbi:MAG: hypothetical protein IBX56_16700 [Methylomicrobium sp.]|nr:hypothetical protein [Methylomicrobium sp.]